MVGGKETLDAFAEECGCLLICPKIGHVPAAFAEILIAGGAFLAVPALLIDEYNRGKQREALDGESQVREVSDGTMSVLEIECVEKLFGALAADLFQRLPHR